MLESTVFRSLKFIKSLFSPSEFYFHPVSSSSRTSSHTQFLLLLPLSILPIHSGGESIAVLADSPPTPLGFV
uniref:Uncharacterized protein n=1 Tax=Caenorhabditis tropicalis TaxID=1561998 RepID=A0A1I7SZN4_9PELO